MRMHIEVGDELVARIDELAGPRGRSAFVRSAIERAVEQESRWALIEAAAGTVAGAGHEWDEDPAAWVRRQRRGDTRRGG
jgi:predicted transcriptional regulator